MRLKKNIIQLASATLAVCALSACEQPVEETEQLPQVNIKTVAELQMPYRYSAAAQAVSMSDSILSAEISANVLSVPAQLGANVKAGDVLVELDCQDAIAMHEQATATLASMKARAALALQQYKRAKSLRKRSGVSEEELNQKQSQYDAARSDQAAQAAQVKLSKRNVERCQLVAPFNGDVIEKYIDAGERVAPGTQLIRLVDSENLELQAQIPADAADFLNNEASPTFVVNGKEYAVQVDSVANVIDPRTRSQAARLSFTAEKPKAGALGKLEWRDKRPVLPAEFLSVRDSDNGVLIVVNNVVDFKKIDNVQAGRPVFFDLPEYTEVITDGRFNVEVGMQVNIINSN